MLSVNLVPGTISARISDHVNDRRSLDVGSLRLSTDRLQSDVRSPKGSTARACGQRGVARMEIMPVTVHLLDEPAEPGAGGRDAVELRQRHMDFLKPLQG